MFNYQQLIQKHTEELVAYSIKKLGAMPGVRIICEKDPKENIGIVSFTVGGAHPHDAGEVLSRDHIAIRGGHHCAMPLMKALKVPAVNRASFYLYNDESDVDALVAGVNKARAIFS